MFIPAVTCWVAFPIAVAVTAMLEAATPPNIARGALTPVTKIGAIAEVDFTPTQAAVAVTAVAALADVIFSVSFIDVALAVTAVLAVALVD